MTMEEVELVYLLQNNVVYTLAGLLSPLFNIQLFQKYAMYDSSTTLILIARLSLFLDGLIQVRCMTFNLQTVEFYYRYLTVNRLTWLI